MTRLPLTIAIILLAMAAACSSQIPATKTTLTPVATPGNTPAVTAPSNSTGTPARHPASRSTATPEARETPAPTSPEQDHRATPERTASKHPAQPQDNHVLTITPASWLDRGVWITSRDGAVQSAGAPDPRSLEEYLAMDESDQARFSEAFARIIPPDLVVALRQSPQEWKEKLGLDLFSIGSTAATGTTSGPPYGPVILTGDFRDSEIIRNLLNSGYEPQTHKGKEFHAIRKDFGTNLREPVLGNSRTNRVFASAEIMATAPDTASMKDFLDVLTGEADPIRENNLVLAAVESLGDISTAAALTRNGVFNPEGQTPLKSEKPPGWGTLDTWKILAAGSGIQDGQPFLAISIAFEDPDAAGSNIEEMKTRVGSYRTIVPQRFPEDATLNENWPAHPFDEVCNSISIDSQRWTSGSTITIKCRTEAVRFWAQMLDMRDLGFLVH